MSAAARPYLLGIVNVTPDSFSDGGALPDADAAVAHALRLIEEGADWLDIGGESTRPGAEPVPVEVELARVLPVIRGVVARAPSARVSVDTYKPEVARQALAAGASIVNDVRALTESGMAEVCAAAGCDVIIMHSRGTPQTMGALAVYHDVVREVVAELVGFVERAGEYGVRRERIWVDPGLGFAKDTAHNIAIMRDLGQITGLGLRVVLGASRKRFIGALTGVESSRERVYGSVGAALAAASAGVSVLRVHDVAATRQALDVYITCQSAAGRGIV